MITINKIRQYEDYKTKVIFCNNNIIIDCIDFKCLIIRRITFKYCWDKTSKYNFRMINYLTYGENNAPGMIILEEENDYD